jgi:5-methylcytosine-specific restriction endonuclease McrA
MRRGNLRGGQYSKRLGTARPKPGSRRFLIAELDRVTSLIVRKRDNFRCVLCGSTYEPQAGHIFKRGLLAVRWSLENIWTQCSGCNVRHNVRPEIYMTWAIKKLGCEVFAALRDRAFSEKRFEVWELEVKLDELKEMLK